jgi:transposase
LIEAAWCYRFPARVSRELLLRQEEQPKPIRDIAWKAQIRPCARYRKLARTGKPANVVTAAVARAGGLHLGHCLPGHWRDAGS